MKTRFFTIGVGNTLKIFAQRLRADFYQTNGLDLTVLPEEVIKDKHFPRGSHPCWISCFLWDFVEKETERIVWLDADIECGQKLDYISEAPFAGVIDSGDEITRNNKMNKIFKGMKNYFNNGYFSMTRDMESLFQRIRIEIHSPLQDSCPEQTWTNYYLNNVADQKDIEILPEKYNYMAYSKKNIHKPVPGDVVFLHHSGLQKPSVKGERFMPIQNFDPIETDHYRLSPTLLEVEKNYLNVESGEKIFTKHNVSATIIETLSPDMCFLRGKRIACARFRLSATKLTESEILMKETADKKRRAEEDAKMAKEAAQEAEDAPPPGPVLLKEERPKTRQQVLDELDN